MKLNVNSKPKRFYTLLLSVLIFLFSACEKSSPTPEPAPATPKPGAVKGLITPADAAVKVVCTPAGGGQPIELPSPNGNFKINDLAAGTYSVSVIPKLGYLAPAGVTVTIAGDTANAGTLNLAGNGQSTGYLRFTMDGSLYDITLPNVSCTYAANVFTITATTPPTIPYYTFKFNLDNVTGSGTFNMSPSTTNRYIEATHHLSLTTMVWSTDRISADPMTPSGSGTIILSGLDAAIRVASGTFLATLRGSFGSIKRITNGSFQLNY